MKYNWKVSDAPVGRYRSFERRSFPMAYYKRESPAADISGSEEDWEYNPKQIVYKSLTLRIADHSFTPWKWRRIVKRYKTIQECKDAFERILRKHPEIAPKSNVPEFMKLEG